MKALEGMLPEEMKLREGCAVYQALCTLAVCFSSHEAICSLSVSGEESQQSGMASVVLISVAPGHTQGQDNRWIQNTL